MPATPDPLRDLLGKKLAEAKAKALKDELAKEDIDAADRVVKLAAMQEAQDRVQPSRFKLVLVVAMVLAAVCVPLFLHLGTTNVELEATANALTFHLPEATPLTRNWVVSSAGLLGYAQAAFDEGGAMTDVAIPAGPGTVLLEALPDAKNAGSLTLAGIETAGPATVVAEPRQQGEYRIHIDSPGTKLTLSAHGRVRLNRSKELVFTGAPKDFVFCPISRWRKTGQIPSDRRISKRHDDRRGARSRAAHAPRRSSRPLRRRASGDPIGRLWT